MLDDLVDVIETLQERIQTHSATLRANEIRTRTALIDPMLTALGWEVSDPALVTPEYTVGAGRADYALHGSESIPAAMIEAKRLGHALNDDERMQMLNYANARGVRYAAVTDGDIWEFYEVFKQAPLEDRRLLNLRIANRSAHESALQLLLLWRPNLASGQPMAASEPIFRVSTERESIEKPDIPNAAMPPPAPEVASVHRNWVALSSFTAQRGMKHPTTIKFPDGTEYPLASRRDLLVRTAEWLVSNGSLTSNSEPVLVRGGNATKGYCIVNNRPVHPNGEDFAHPRKINGTSLVVNVGTTSAVSKAKTLLEHCGVSPDTVYLQTGE